MMNRRQVERKIEELEKEIRIWKEVLENPINPVMGRPIGSIKYTSEQLKFLNENKEKPMKEIVNEFNKKFNTNFKGNSRALYNLMDREGIISPKRDFPNEKTDDEIRRERKNNNLK